ncbi:hypothetical protein HJC23_000029 [Cyclotella cryptica]|uniref:LITAF domain-containing protein n=1 Tax=Cyclotella cryptica TaxID=29204 RepID=A0ABD3P1X0_9STRA
MPEESSTNDTAPAAAVDVETGEAKADAAKVGAALEGIELGRSFPVTIPECPHCHKKNVMTKLNTHATWETYVTCVVLGIISCLVLWWLPLVLDSVRDPFSILDIIFSFLYIEHF